MFASKNLRDFQGMTLRRHATLVFMDSFLTDPVGAAIDGAMGAMKVKLYLFDKTQLWTANAIIELINFDTDTVFVYIKLVDCPAGTTSLIQLIPHMNMQLAVSGQYYFQAELVSLRQLQLRYFDNGGSNNTRRTLALIYTFS